jgi:hypothetical protein
MGRFDCNIFITISKDEISYYTFFSFRMLTNDISTSRLQYEIEAKIPLSEHFQKPIEKL